MCEGESEVTLLGGIQPGEGTVIFRNGLVCDDSWDLKVSVFELVSSLMINFLQRMLILFVGNLATLGLKRP